MRTRIVLACIGAVLYVGRFTGLATASQPAVYYSFDTLGTTVEDLSGNGNNGTINGAVALDDAGYLGKCFAFNGSDSYVLLNRVIQDSFGITAWIKTDVAGPAGTHAYEGSGLFWSDVAGGANDFVVGVLGTKLSLFAGNPDTSVTSNEDVVTSEWMHIAAVRNTTAKTLNVYVNGAFDNKVSHSNTSALNANPQLAIGANTLDSRYYSGLIDEVRLYSRVLTDSQVATLYVGETPDFGKAESPNPADGLVGLSTALLQWTKGDGAVQHDVYLGDDPDLTEADRVASGSKNVFYYHVAGLVAGATYYWRVDEIEANGTIHTGDVWTFVAQADAAYYPTPADAANNAQLTSSLTWYAGKGALKHHLYFGGDADAVAGGTAEVDQGLFDAAATTFDPGTLDALTTYYWRVDENKAGNVVLAGPVWSFSTVLPVEDFESYNDDDNRIFDSWLDGYVNGTGATVGNWNSPFAELTIVHDVNQAMPLDYNNVDSPYYSEAEYEFDTAQDWTADDASTLVLYVRGKMGNAAVPLYVGITDSSNKTALVTHPDGAIATRTKWVEWQIPLADFANVSKTRVKKLFIGLGDSENPTAGGKGRMYIDTICLAK
jgi:hypothetical protein